MPQTNEDRIHLFQHGATTGAMIRLLPDESSSLNHLLPETYQQSPDQDLTLSYSCCFVQHRGGNVLVDAGIDGDEVSASLRDFGVEPQDVELVCITHADRDHVAGLLLQIGDGELTYPEAHYAIDAGLWAELHNPESYESLPKHLRRLFQRLKALIEDRVILCPEEMEVVDGLRFIPCPGHRPGHAAYQFDTEHTPILHVGDALLHPVFAEHLDWPCSADTDPEQAMASRQMILSRGEERAALVLATHAPWPGIVSSR